MLKQIAQSAAQEAMRAALRSEVERVANELSVNHACVTIEFGYYPDSDMSELWHWRASLWSPDGDPEECGEASTPHEAADALLRECEEAERAARNKRRKRKRRKPQSGEEPS